MELDSSPGPKLLKPSSPVPWSPPQSHPASSRKGHRVPPGNYAPGQLGFLCIKPACFCPYLVVVWLLGCLPGECAGGNRQPCSQLLPAPLSWKTAPKKPAGRAADLPGKGVKALFFLLASREEFFLRCFCGCRMFLLQEKCPSPPGLPLFLESFLF